MSTTVALPPTPTPVLEYARLLLEHHRLEQEGIEEGPVIDALADKMDGPWYEMTDQERKRMRGLSADLYSLAERGRKTVELSPEDGAAWKQTAQEAFAHFHQGEIDATLEFLRGPVPSTFPRHQVLYFQSRCWEKLGDLETALVFAREAEREDAQHAIAVLWLLDKMGRHEQMARQEEKIVSRFLAA